MTITINKRNYLPHQKGNKPKPNKATPENPREKDKERSAYPGLGQNAQQESPGGSPKERKKTKTAIKITKSLPPPRKKKNRTTTLNLKNLVLHRTWRHPPQLEPRRNGPT